MSILAANLTRLQFFQKVPGKMHVWYYVQNSDGSRVQEVFLRIGRRRIPMYPADKRFHGYLERTFDPLDPAFIYHARVFVGSGLKAATIASRASTERAPEVLGRLWFWSSRRKVSEKEHVRRPSLPRILTWPLGVLLILGYNLALPFYRFRILVLTNPERLGHLAGNTEIFLAEQSLGLHGSKPDKTILYIPQHNFVEGYGYLNTHGKVANECLLNSWRKHCWIVREKYIPQQSVGLLRKYCPEAVGRMRDHGHRDIFNVLPRTKPAFELPAHHRKEGERYLKETGLAGKKWVCFHSRSDAHLKKVYESLTGDLDAARYSYRNTDPKTFYPALQYLVDKGYYVIRMGIEEKPWSFQHPMAIDYAIQPRHDWMDIFLIEQCAFFLGNTSGIYALAEICRRPVVFTNFAPLGHFYSFNENYLTIFKRMVDATSGDVIPIATLRKERLLETIHQDKWRRKNYTYVNNTPEEIVEVVQEMVARMEGNWQESEQNDVLQKQFAAGFKRNEFHQKIRGRVGSTFLQNNVSWLIEESEIQT